MLNLGAVGKPWRQSGIDRLWHSQHSQSGSVISRHGSAARLRHTLGHEGNWGGGGEVRCLAVIQRLVVTITLCPDLANSGPSFLSPVFLGQRHLAMLIFARHSVANRAGFASPHQP
jgi:hypothetical protein